jgi:hypothetical protein
MRSWGSSGGVVNKLLSESSSLLIPVVENAFSLLQIVHTGSGIHPFSYLKVTGILPWGAKRPETETHNHNNQQ